MVKNKKIIIGKIQYRPYLENCVDVTVTKK